MQHDPQPFFKTFSAPRNTNLISTEQAEHDAAAAGRITSREQMARDAAFGRPMVAPPMVLQIREPSLPDDFRQRISELDKQISERGIGVNREHLVSLGRERFAALLAADRKCRVGAVGAGIDLSSFEHIQSAIHAFECQIVPPRKTSEQISGRNKDQESVRQICGWNSLWKATHERVETLNDLYRFHDQFESLLLAHSMAEQLAPDDRARSSLFRGGRGRKVDLFLDWLPAVEGHLVHIKLTGSLWSVVSWLSGEKARPPFPSLLAREFFNVRAPSPAQERIAAATVDGFLFGHDGWLLWDYIGKHTRTAVSETRLASWRDILSKRYRRITEFHALVASAFFKDIGYGFDAHKEFNSTACRAFISRTVERLLDCAGALLALGLDEVFPGAVLARFQTSALVDGQREEFAGKRASISRQLQAAFPDSEFNLKFEGNQP